MGWGEVRWGEVTQWGGVRWGEVNTVGWGGVG